MPPLQIDRKNRRIGLMYGFLPDRGILMARQPPIAAKPDADMALVARCRRKGKHRTGVGQQQRSLEDVAAEGWPAIRMPRSGKKPYIRPMRGFFRSIWRGGMVDWLDRRALRLTPLVTDRMRRKFRLDAQRSRHQGKWTRPP